MVGGGDGGVARELARHPAVEEVVQCEIDEEVSTRFAPLLALIHCLSEEN